MIAEGASSRKKLNDVMTNEIINATYNKLKTTKSYPDNLFLKQLIQSQLKAFIHLT